MLREDRSIYARFLAKFPEFEGDFKYDIHVGTNVNQGIGKLPDPFVKMARALYSKRIDVVIEDPKSIWIVEIKPHASLSAIGQVLGYSELFKRDHPEIAKPVFPMILTDRTGEDEKFMCNRFGIKIIHV